MPEFQIVNVSGRLTMRVECYHNNEPTLGEVVRRVKLTDTEAKLSLNQLLGLYSRGLLRNQVNGGGQ